MAVASVNKYWTSVWARATESADLSELIKMAEMNTVRSHVLNCEVYKMLAMKVDELCSTVVGTWDIDVLRLENKTLCARLAIVADSMAQAMFKVTKVGTIQMICAQAQKKAELQLKICEEMVHVQHKELTEALAELSKAKDLLANL
ncbi:hypothetical protein Fot_35520 [Forsythia ovata]|uniref:Uncharacterized protein n=1 Tax=Forsythia ovata TaxID=205694 RepID=A0ABD1SLR9_9LAMI